MKTNIQTFIDDLDAGVLQEKLAQALSDVAAGVVDFGTKGQVSLQFDLKQISNSHQVEIKHKLTYMRPTAKGKITEVNTTSTPMYVGTGGSLTLFPEGQNQLFDKKGNAEKQQ